MDEILLEPQCIPIKIKIRPKNNKTKEEIEKIDMDTEL